VLNSFKPNLNHLKLTMKKIFPILLVALIWFACKNNSPSSVQQEEKKTDSLTLLKNDTNNCRLVVRFNSPSKPEDDLPLVRAYEDSIGSFSLYFGKTIDYKKNPWGPEGETDFCLKLNELTEAEQQEFINRSRTMLEKVKWAKIYEYYPCPKLVHHRK
jgi:hypothetical protein